MKSCSITFGLLLLAGVAAAQWTPHADAILTNGSVVSVDDDFSIYEAVAIKDGRIIALGATDAVLTHRGDDTHVSDLEGRVVIPGLQDSHIHFLGLGHDVAYEVELSYAESAAEIVDAVRRVKKRRRLAPGEWLTGRRWDQYKYPEMVTRWQLDAVTPDNPVAIYRVYRGVAVNTETFRLMGIVDTEPETWPAWWLEDPENFTFEDKIYRAERSLVIDGREETREVPTGVFLGSKGSRLVTKRPPPLSFDDDVESVRLGVRAPASPPWTPPALSGTHCLWARGNGVGLLGSECSCGHLVTTPLTPRLSCLLQFPVPLRPDLWGLASHEVQRRNVAYPLSRSPL